eukprot:CAMPEP_0201490456 /NCGR_PEP_ID=MMETSP0151_2-20130828/26563_1 /ASSEMBLY_ACC=CAM_ASM_000257 /TAXON_ID=200890 /ORGANISM="Paramoeba atlantica, Strain 621/1 / CCAP 1560/9" /LENGTH=319 /DNA_ID=CAMNT_0047876423 /DNA_START=56 /DNA_END=1011 /DNA_ORIENTATION=-
MKRKSRENVVKNGDKVVLFGGSANYVVMHAQKGQKFCHKWGVFDWDDIIGQQYGSRVSCAKKTRSFEGHVYLLRPTPEVYTAGALAHRTQLIYSTDISVITLLLNLRPGNLVVESGTGSGSLSRALLRIVAPHGHLYTFEFHKGRADGVREDLIADGFGKNVTVTHRDVCSDGFFDDDTDADSEKSSSSCPTPSKKIDAVMLDLPKPWEAIPHAVKILKYGVGRICCYSPCVEQVQRTCEVMRSYNFEEMRTIEVVRRPFSVNAQSQEDVTISRERKKKEPENMEIDSTKSNLQTYLTDEVMVRPHGEIRGHSSFLTFA